MKTYKIPAVWQMYGYVDVVADSLAEAVHIAEDSSAMLHCRGWSAALPTDATYLEGSFEIDHDALDAGLPEALTPALTSKFEKSC